MESERVEFGLMTFQILFHGLISMFPTYIHIVRALTSTSHCTVYGIH